MSFTSIWSPTITTTRAPIRSACFSWPFSERPACSICARRPASRSSCASTKHLAGCASATATNTSALPVVLGLAGGKQDPLDARRPAHARSRRAAQLLDQAVVAAAAAERRLRPQALGLELEHRARVVVEPAHERGIDLVGHPGLVEQRPHLGEVLRVLRGQPVDAGAARRPSPPGCPGGRRRTRAAGSARAARAPPPTARLRARAGMSGARRCSPRGSPECRGSTAAGATAPRPTLSKISASSRISSASSVGSSEPSASASIWVNWRKRPACGASWRKNGPAVQTFTGCGSLCMPCSMYARQIAGGAPRGAASASGRPCPRR